ncbi:MAG: MotA/TolQ/ExbB proton channel family protein [Flavobacteriales bacterium]
MKQSGTVSAPKAKSGMSFSSIFPYLAIPAALLVGYLIFSKILGDPANFEGGDPVLGHPIDGNLYGTIYKGGYIVPFLIATNIIVITFFLERLISLLMARGTGSVPKFISTVRGHLNAGEVDKAIAACDKQKGSVGAVMRAGLVKYKALSQDNTLDKETKVNALKQELEEATSLELPMLSKNLVILSTSASLGVLIGLLGTVSGMIKSFSAMAAGVPDPAQLSVGISEALVNTFLGILASAIAILLYNFFSNRIDQLTYGIDEAGFSVAQTFASKH